MWGVLHRSLYSGHSSVGLLVRVGRAVFGVATSCGGMRLSVSTLGMLGRLWRRKGLLFEEARHDLHHLRQVNREVPPETRVSSLSRLQSGPIAGSAKDS